MAARVRLTNWAARPGAAWIAAAALVGMPAAVLWFWRGDLLHALSWQPELAWTEPWRWWTAAWVHLSLRHLLANLAGAAVVGAFGWAARAPAGTAWAWIAAWPLTHLGLLMQPALQRYAGASGVLHAGVAVTAVQLTLQPHRRLRMLGATVLAGLLLKIALEGPWRGPLIHPPEWDIAVAPLAHALGVAWGVLCALLLAAGSRCRQAQNV